MNGAAPSLLVFAREVGEPLAGLASAADEFLAQHEAARGFIVVVGEQAELQDQVVQLVEGKGLKIPLCFLADGPEGEAATALKLNADAKFTVLVYRDKQVTSNLALDELSAEVLAEIIGAWQAAVGP